MDPNFEIFSRRERRCHQCTTEWIQRAEDFKEEAEEENPPHSTKNEAKIFLTSFSQKIPVQKEKGNFFLGTVLD